MIRGEIADALAQDYGIMTRAGATVPADDA